MIVGVLGGGQLARMLALAGYPLGLEFIFLCPDRDACAVPLGEHLQADFDDESALISLAERADVVTYEFENVPLKSVEFLAGRVPVHPSPQALATAQDRLREKRLFREMGIPTPAFAPVDSLAELQQAVAEIGLPAVLKTRCMGYDGKGQALLRHPDDLLPAWESLHGVPAIVEAFIRFEREVSIIAVRDPAGKTMFYPLSENTHRDGILRLSLSRPGDPMQAQAEAHAQRLLDDLDYVGILALEFFQMNEALLANEFAPRVHNSGHWTIEGDETSQFENHLRAVLGLPLGTPTPVGVAAMVNFISMLPSHTEVLALPQVHLHAYGKSPKPGRKVGHATVRTDDARRLEQLVTPLLVLAEAADAE